MAKRAKAGLATKSTQQSYTTKWLRNALKSVGISTQEALKEISPNLYEVTTTGVATSRNIVNTLRRNTNNTNRIGEALQTNKYVKYAQKAYKNAMADIKSGNLNNQDRMDESMESSMMGDTGNLEEGFSFGDDGAEASSVNVNYINNNNNGAMLHMSNQIQAQSKAQISMQKASMDAYIAVNAAGMQQVGQIGTEVINQLTNVNNQLAALVQYQNENMSKYIEASLAYYEHAGKAISGSNANDSDRMLAKDVFNSSSGGVNLNNYKTYVKQNAKKMFENSNVGLLKSLADDPMMMEMIVSNPLGFLSQNLVGYMIPNVLKTSMETMETTFSNFMPTMLSKIADLADTEGSGYINDFKRMIGKTFGLKTERTKNIGNIQINRDAIPFDGETKHAITEIITKELRDQSGYLEIIANHFSNGKAKQMARQKGEYWSYNKNKYINREEIDVDIADKIVDSIRNAFNGTKFGQSLTNDLVNTRKSEAAQKEMAFTLDELFVEIEKQKGHVTLDDLITLINNGGASKKTKDVIKKYVKKMSYQNRNAFDSLNTARIMSQGSAEEAKKAIMDDPTANNILNSSFAGDADVDEILAQVKKYGSWSDRKARNVRGMNRATQTDGNANTRSMARMNSNRNTNQDRASKLTSIITNASNNAVDVMQSIMSGNTQGVINKGAEFISDGFKSIGVKLQELSQKEGGVIWGVKENFKNITTEVKDGIMMKFFGKKKDESGKYVTDENEHGGIFGTISKTFTAGFNGWIDAFFGKDETDPDGTREKHKTNIINALKDNLPNGITGGMIGTGIGMMSSGSILGMLVGGPFGGAVLGATTGFLAKNEKFQKWLFGDKDEDGNRTGGLISKKVQDYFKSNKNKLIGGAAVGSITGGITGGGLLGMLVGGPIAGSIMGVAGSVLASSDTFKSFLYGNEKTGQKGIFKAVSDAFNKGFKSKGGKKPNGADASQTAGMGILGTGAGALTAGLLGKMGIIGAALTPAGPIGGALAGLAISIKAQSGSFKKWLFGEEDGLDLGDGRKAKKQGVLGQLGNQITVSIINPMKTEIEYIAKDFMSTMKGKVLAPFAFTAEAISGKVGEVFGKLTSQISESFSGIKKSVTETVSKLLSPFTNAIGKTLEKATDFTWGVMKRAISTPGNIMIAAIKALDLKKRFNNLAPVKFIKNLAKDVRNLIFKSIKTTFKTIVGVATAPFKLLGKGIGALWKGTKAIAGKITNSDALSGVKDKINNSKFMQIYRERTRGQGTEDDSLVQRINRFKDKYKEEQKQIKAERKRQKMHNDNAKIIARASNKQFSQDTEEARTWLKYNNRKAYKKLVGESITDEQNREKAKAEIEKNGRGTRGLNLERADMNDLSEEGRQTKLLFDIQKFVGKIANRITGNEDGEPSERSVKKAQKKQLKQHMARRKKWVEYKDYMVNTETGEVRNIDFTEANMEDVPDAVLDYSKNIQENGGVPKAPTMVSDTINNIKNVASHTKNYFKNDFMSNIRGMFKNQEPDATRLSNETGEHMEGHAIGGVLKKGLSIVGEKGAELLYKAKDGLTSILDADSTEEAIDDARNNKGKRNKLRNWISKVSGIGRSDQYEQDDALENYSDEQRSDSKKRALFRAKKGKNNELTANDEANLATIAERDDLRRDSQEEAMSRAKTHDQLLKEREEEEEKEENKKYREAMLASTQENTKSNKDYHSTWDSIWNPKKGLLALAAIAGYTWLKNNLPGLFTTIGNIASTILGIAGTTLGGIISDVQWTDENGARTNGNDKKKQAKKIKDDAKEGNLITDEEGNATQRTTPLVKGLGRTAVNILNADVKTPGTGYGAKISNLQKGIYNKTKKGVKKVARKVKKVGDAGVHTAKYVGGKLKNTKAGKAVSKVASVATAPARGVATATSAVTKNIKNVAGSAATKITDKASKNDGLLSKVCSYVEKFFSFVSENFAKIAGSSATASTVGDATKKGVLSALKKNWSKLCEKMSAKILAVTGVQVGAATVSAGITEGVFATIGAVDGGSTAGTAKLFQIDSSKVDNNMRLISGIFGALTGLTIGAIIDIVFALVGEILGTDILHNLAVALYNKLVGDDEVKIKNLENAEKMFKDAYIKDRKPELKKQYNTQKKAGIIDDSVSFEDFQKGVNDGTYKASYKSFNDYNVEKNASLIDKGTSAVSKVWKGAKKKVGSAKGFLFGETNSIYTDNDTGYTYTQNADGTYQVKDTKGKDLGYVAEEALPKNTRKTTYKSKGFIPENLDKAKKAVTDFAGDAGKSIKSFGKTAFKKAGEGASFIASNTKRGASYVSKKVGQAGTALQSFGSSVVNTVGQAGTTIANTATSAATATKNFLTSHKEKAWVTTDGSYYQSNGKGFNHYSAAGDLIGQDIDSGTFMNMCQSGELTEGDVKVDSGIKKGLKSFSNKVSSTWDTAVNKLQQFGSDVITKRDEIREDINKKVDWLINKETTTRYINKDDGSYYDADGQHYNSNGSKMDKISLVKLSELIQTGELKETEVTVKERGIVTLYNNAIDSIQKGFETAVKNVQKFGEDTVKKGKELGKKAKTAIENAATATKNFFVDHKEKAWIAMDGSYYKSDGKGAIHYSANGDIIGQDIDLGTFMNMCQSGELTEGEITEKSGIKKGLKSFQKTLSKGWEDVTTTLGEFGSSVVTKAGEVGTKIAGAATIAATATKNFFVDHKEKAWVAVDGSYYKSNGKSAIHYSANGDIIGQDIDLGTFMNMCQTGELTEGEVTVQSTVKKGLKSFQKSLSKGWEDVTTTLGEFGSSVVTKVKDVGTKIADAASIAATATKNFFLDHKEKAWFATDGSYYKSNGSGFDHYTAKGDLIGQDVDSGTFINMCQTGELTEGEVVVDSTVKKGLKSFQNKLSSGWNTFTTTITDFGEGLANKASELGTRLANTASSALTKTRNFLLSHTEKRWHSAEGGYYQSNGSTYDYYNESGDKMAEGITQEEFEELCKAGTVVADNAESVTVSSGLKTVISSVGTKIKDTFNTVVNKGKAALDKAATVAGNVLDQIKEKGITGFIGGFFKKEKSLVWYDPQGNYYKLNGNGSYTYYNMNGDVLEENVSSSKVESLQQANLLTKGEIIKDSKAKEAIDSIKDKVKEAWESAKSVVSQGWDNFKSWITGGSSGGYGYGGSGSVFDLHKEIQNQTKGGFGNRNPKLGGRGPEMVNGNPYFSQTDSKWGNKAYNTGADNAKMSDTGCGPTAMAMAVDTAKYNSNGVTPMDMASIAKITGNRDETGTNANFINESAPFVGVDTYQSINPTSDDLDNQLSTGNPVVLLGQKNNGNSPYTKAGHYVVAVGKDQEGNVLINDPRGKSYSKAYNMNDVVGDATSSWMVSDKDNGLYSRKALGGFGKKKKKKKKNDDNTNTTNSTTNTTSSSSNTIKASDVISIARGEIGYHEHASASQLESKTANRGGADYTKYGPMMHSVYGHPNHDKWCATFVTWCFWMASGKNKSLTSTVLHNATTASCRANVAKFKAAGAWLSGSGTPKAGYVIYYKCSHTGIVSGVKDGIVYTIEGNSSKQVEPRKLKVGDGKILGYGIPILDSDVNVVNPTATAGLASTTADSTSSTGTTTTSENKLSQLTSYLGSFMSEYASRAISGDFSNTDYSSLLSSGSSSTDTSSSSSATSGDTDTSNIETSGNAGKDVWNYLTQKEGLTKIAAAGVMGNFKSESDLRPSCIEGDHLKNYPGFEAATSTSDRLDSYTTNVLFPAYTRKGKSIKKNAYKGSDGHYYPGFGLAQWTGQRAANLKAYGDKLGTDWRTLDTQLKFFSNYPGEFHGRKGLKGKMQNAKSVDEATRLFAKWYEGIRVLPQRLQNGRNMYKKYAEGGSGEGLSSQYKYRLSKAKEIANGGRGSVVDYSSQFNSLNSRSTDQYNISNNIERYITTSKDNTINALVMNAIEILANIAGNTLDASNKLNNLNNLQNLNISGGTTNVIVDSKGKQIATGSSTTNTADMRRSYVAKQIARGGY